MVEATAEEERMTEETQIDEKELEFALVDVIKQTTSDVNGKVGSPRNGPSDSLSALKSVGISVPDGMRSGAGAHLPKETLEEITKNVYSHHESERCQQVENILCSFVSSKENVQYEPAMCDLAFRLSGLFAGDEELTLEALDFVVNDILGPFFAVQDKERTSLEKLLFQEFVKMVDEAMVGSNKFKTTEKYCSYWIQSMFVTVLGDQTVSRLWLRLFSHAQDNPARARKLLLCICYCVMQTCPEHGNDEWEPKQELSDAKILQDAIQLEDKVGNIDQYIAMENRVMGKRTRAYSTPADLVEVLYLNDDASIQLGETSTGDVFVKRLDGVTFENDVAEDKRLSPGDFILSINDVDVKTDRTSATQILHSLYGLDDPVYIGFERNQNSSTGDQLDYPIWRIWDPVLGEEVLLSVDATLDQETWRHVNHWQNDYDSRGMSNRLPGTFYITSYRVIFAPQNEKELYDAAFHIPLLCVQRIERKDGTCTIYSKNFRHFILRFPNSAGKDCEKVFWQIQAMLRNDPVKRAVNLCSSVDKGWDIYDPVAEARRLGVDGIPGLIIYEQAEYQLCPTYPRILIVSSKCTEQDRAESAKFRSRNRLPVVSWIHPRTRAVLARCAQPLTGLRNSASRSDERIVDALMTKCFNDELPLPHERDEMYMSEDQHHSFKAGRSSSSTSNDGVSQFVSGVWNTVNNVFSDGNNSNSEHGNATSSSETVNSVAGSTVSTTSSYVIMDARSQIASMGNQMLGKGTENPSNYPGSELTFLNIDNIHALRSAFFKLRQLTLPNANNSKYFYQSVAETGWLQQVHSMLSASLCVARTLEYSHKSVLTHCSDGWDRTAQMCSMAMLLLDPFYRTCKGFAVLVEKEWVSMGHQFKKRYANGSSSDNDNEQVSPCFTLFIDCVFQILVQYPNAFEFNEDFLIALLDHIVSGKYATFLFDCEKEIIQSNARATTNSVWSLLILDPNAKKSFVNPNYGLVNYPILPRITYKCIKLWERYYFRFDKTMIVSTPVTLVHNTNVNFKKRLPNYV